MHRFYFQGTWAYLILRNDVLLVDVGGGRGKLLERFRQQIPDLQGRMIP